MPRKRLVTILTAVMLAAGITFAVASPAAASTTCNQTTYVLLAGGHPGAMPSSSQDLAGLSCGLAYGATGNGVKNLQATLNSCYHDQLASGYNGFAATGPLQVDGQFGTLTKRALQIAQSVAGVSPDGSFGPVTRAAIEWVDAEQGGCRLAQNPLRLAS